MIKPFKQLQRLLLRFRYPVSLPEDVANAFGVQLTNFITFSEFMDELIKKAQHSPRLKKLLHREAAERVFEKALRKEIFQHSSLFSYYFTEGWLEVILQFDDQSRLRRLYIQHKLIPEEEGVEISLRTDSFSNSSF